MLDKVDDNYMNLPQNGNPVAKQLNGMSEVEKIFIGQFISLEMNVLLLNCESEETLEFMISRCKKLTVVSSDEKFREHAQSNYASINFFDMPAFQLNFDDDYFNAVIFCNNGIDYVYPESKRILAFGEVWKILKRSGLFIFSSHNRDAKITSTSSLLNILTNLITFQFLNDYWFEINKNGLKLVWYGQIENELLTLRDLGFNIADMSDLERKKAINCYVVRKR